MLAIGFAAKESADVDDPHDHSVAIAMARPAVARGQKQSRRAQVARARIWAIAEADNWGRMPAAWREQVSALPAAGCRDWGVTRKLALSQWIAVSFSIGEQCRADRKPGGSERRPRSRLVWPRTRSGSSRVVLPRGAEARRPPFWARAAPPYGVVST